MGEQTVGSQLDRLAGSGAAVLHDRRLRGSRANIDHIVVAPSGVWVIDTKNYSGPVRHRNNTLSVNGRDRSNLILGMAKQVAAVERALDTQTITVRPVLCFTGSQWYRFSRPFSIDGVLVVWPAALVETIRRAPDRFVSVSQVSASIATRLPSAAI